MPERDGVDRDEEVVRVVIKVRSGSVLLDCAIVLPSKISEDGRERRERHGPIIGAPSVRLGPAVRRVVHGYLQNILRENV